MVGYKAVWHHGHLVHSFTKRTREGAKQHAGDKLEGAGWKRVVLVPPQHIPASQWELWMPDGSYTTGQGGGLQALLTAPALLLRMG